MMIQSFVAMVALAGAAADDIRLSTTLMSAHDRGDLASIELWSNREGITNRGDAVRVYFRTDRDAYVTIFRVDTDGRVRILFPEGPWENNYARHDRRYEVRAYGARHAFVVDDDPGQGYLFAVTSVLPFRYHDIVTGARWDYRYVAYDGRIVGDPYVALLELADVIVPPNYDGYDYDILPYDVGHRYDYPRFLCYDCHSYVRYAHWNPYDRGCFEFRVIVYDDPYYYPARRYAGTHVVFTRPKRLEPRYVIVKRTERSPDVVVEPRRPAPEDRRPSRSWTGRDVGGVGRVPAPVADPRTTPRRAPIEEPAHLGERPTPRRESPSVDERRRPSTSVTPTVGEQGAAQATPRREPAVTTRSDTAQTRRRPSGGTGTTSGAARSGAATSQGATSRAKAAEPTVPARSTPVRDVRRPTAGTAPVSAVPVKPERAAPPEERAAPPVRQEPAAPAARQPAAPTARQEPKRAAPDSASSQSRPILRRRPSGG